MAAVRKWISENSLTTTKAAEVLQVSQSRISDLVRGKPLVCNCSLMLYDILMKILAELFKSKTIAEFGWLKLHNGRLLKRPG